MGDLRAVDDEEFIELVKHLGSFANGGVDQAEVADESGAGDADTSVGGCGASWTRVASCGGTGVGVVGQVPDQVYALVVELGRVTGGRRDTTTRRSGASGDEQPEAAARRA